MWSSDKTSQNNGRKNQRMILVTGQDHHHEWLSGLLAHGNGFSSVALLDCRDSEDAYGDVLSMLSTVERTELGGMDDRGSREIEVWYVISEDVPPQLVAQSLATLRDLGERYFRTHLVTGVIILAEGRDLIQVEGKISTLVRQNRDVDRGWLLMSPISADGYQLSNHDFEQVAQDLLELLLTTDLPQTIDRELMRWSDTQSAVVGVGVTRWCWSPDEAIEACAHAWAKEVLEGWLYAPETPDGSVGHLIEGWGLDPTRLSKQLKVQLPSVSPWQLPQPWGIAAALQEQLEWFDKLEEEIEYPEAVVETIWQGLKQALIRRYQDLLNGRPHGGLALARKEVQLIVEQLVCFQERAETDTIQSESHGEVYRRDAYALCQDVRAHLEHWPDEAPADWLKVMTYPWRWPRMAQSIWDMNQLGEELETVQRASLQWKASLVKAQHLLRAYDRLIDWFGWLEAQLEEVALMLMSERQSLPEPPPSSARYRPLLDQLVDPLPLEAAAASEAINGHGQFIDDLPIGLGERLIALGRKRFASIARWTAADYLMTRMPDVWEREVWSYRQTEQARLLWPIDEMNLNERTRSGREELLWVFISDDPQKIGFGSEKIQDYLWVHSKDDSHIWTIRLQLPIVGIDK